MSLSLEDLGLSASTYSGGGSSNAATIVLWVFAVLFLLGAAAGAVYFFSQDREDRKTGFMGFLFRFLNFRLYFMPYLIKYFYLFSVPMGLVYAIVQMFEVSFGYGLVLLFALPISLRLLFEGIYLIYSMREELSLANRYLRKATGGEKLDAREDSIRMPNLNRASRNPAPRPAQPQRPRPEAPRPEGKRCPNCGAICAPGEKFCGRCGADL